MIHIRKIKINSIYADKVRSRGYEDESGSDQGGDEEIIVPVYVTVTFNGNGGESQESQIQVEQGKSLENGFPTAERRGYDFVGWFTEAEGGTQAISGDVITEDVTYYAHWQIIQYPIVYNMNGHGVEPNGALRTYTIESEAYTPPNPEYVEDYEFMGWTPPRIVKGSTGKKTFTANWEVREYVVTWESSGGNQIQSTHVPVGTAIGELPVPEREGYDFIGWWTEPEWGQRISEEQTITQNVTFYAHWLEAEQPIEMVTVVFMDTSDTEFSRMTVEKGSVISELPTPQKEGYDFNGWYLQPSGGDRISEVTATADTVLYAQWKEIEVPVEYVTIVFKDIDGSELSRTTVVKGSYVSVSEFGVPEKTGWTFDDWYSQAQGGEKVDELMANEDAVLYAHWNIVKCTVTWNSCGGTPINETILNYGSNLGNLPVPVLDDHQFIGWYESENGTGEMATSETTITSDMTYYAYWNSSDEEDEEEEDRNIGYTTFTLSDGRTDEYDIQGQLNVDVMRNLGYLTYMATRGESNITCTWNEEIVSVRVGNQVTEIDDAFHECSTLKSVTIAKGVETISENTFATCESLESVVFEDIDQEKIESLDNYPWGIEEVAIITTKEYAPAPAQSSGNSIVTFLNGTTKKFNWIGTVTNDVVKESGLTDRNSVKSIIVGSDVTTLINNTFDTFVNLEHVTIPNSVTYIGYGAFSQCVKLNNVVIPNSVTALGDAAFNRCRELTEITIPDSVKEMTWRVFQGCSKLKTVNLGNGLQKIGEDMFQYCGLENITIPGTVDEIGDNCFGESTKLESVTIENGVRTIGNQVFIGCENLKHVNIPNSVKEIGNEAFSWCSNELYDIDATSKVSMVDGWVVWQWTNETYDLEEHKDDLPSGSLKLNDIKGISKYAFLGNNYITDVEISGTDININYGAFNGCTQLEKVVIGSGVKKLGQYAFVNCPNLNQFKISNDVETIENGNFNKCGENLCDVTTVPGLSLVDGWVNGATGNISGQIDWTKIRGFVDGTVYVWKGMNWQSIFNGLTGSVALPTGLKVIPENLFRNCTGISKVVIPKSVIKICSNAFCGCSGLNEIVVEEGNPNYKSVNGLLLSKDGRHLIKGINGEITIPDGVTTIEPAAFQGCAGLTNVKIPDTIIEIGEDAFKDCSSIKRISIPQQLLNSNLSKTFISSQGGITHVTILDGATHIGSGTFSSWWDNFSNYHGWGSLTTVVMPNTVTEIEDRAFYDCRVLTDADIPDSVTYIGDQAFARNTSLETINIPNNLELVGGNAFSYTPFYDSLPDGLIVFGKSVYKYKGSCPDHIDIPDGTLCISGEAFQSCKSLTSVTIPSSVTNIGGQAFNGTGLVHLAVPEGVTSIGDGAFMYCQNLQTAMISDSVAKIGEMLFSYCTNLRSVKLPSGLCEIPYRTFHECKWLSDVNIPSSVTFIGSQAFYGCGSLENLTLPDTIIEVEGGSFEGAAFYNNIPDGLVIFGHCLYGVKGSCPEKVVIPKGITTINYSVFKDKYGIKSIVIPDGVTTIQSFAFAGCHDLTSITIPDSVVSIDRFTFTGCENLNDVVLGGGMTSIPEHMFDGCSKLQSITIPRSIERCWAFSFAGCNSLSIVYVEPSDTYRVREILRDYADVSRITFIEQALNQPRKYAVTFDMNGGIFNIATKIVRTNGSSTEVEIPEIVKKNATFWFDTSEMESEIGKELDIWNDVRGDGYPSLTTYTSIKPRIIQIQSGKLKDKPAIDFRNFGNICDMKFNKTQNVKTVFFVVDIDQNFGAFLLGGPKNNCAPPRNYGFHRGQGGTYRYNIETLSMVKYWNNGEPVENPKTTMIPSGYQLITWSWDKSADVLQICSDREIEGRIGGKRLCEVIAFEQELDDYSRNLVERYLREKWFTKTDTVPTGKVGTLPTPSRTGYDFSGWFTERNGGRKITSEEKVTGNVTFYAHWEIVTYNITYNMNGHGDALQNLLTTYTVESGSYVPPNAHDEDWVFVGWTPPKIESGQTGDVCFTANWYEYQHSIPDDEDDGDYDDYTDIEIDEEDVDDFSYPEFIENIERIDRTYPVSTPAMTQQEYEELMDELKDDPIPEAHEQTIERAQVKSPHDVNWNWGELSTGFTNEELDQIDDQIPLEV